ncbi:MAG TPA: FtsX-like permease family protein [Acidobacteriota bacterium]
MGLWLISFRNFRINWLKNLLTTFGIVLGVAVFFAMRTANLSLREGFRNTLDRVAGKAQLQVTAGEVGLPEELLEKVQRVEGVDMAVPVIEAVVQTEIREEGNLLILGVDFTGDTRLRGYQLEDQSNAEIDDPLLFLAQPDSICLTHEFALRNHIQVGDAITVETALGPRRFAVRGLIAPGDLATAFGGNVAVMDIYAAQYMFSRGRHFDRIDITLQPGIAIDSARSALRRQLGVGFKVDTPDQRGKQMENLTSGFSIGLFLSSLIALLVGVFLIFNSFAVSVTRRRKDIGILRALGATRRQIEWLFIAEALFMGTAGSCAGVAIGWYAARGVISFMDRVVRESYNVSVKTVTVQTSLAFIVLAVALGISASLIGALIPARAAARVDPVLALQKGKFQMLMAGESRRRRLIGGTLLVAALAFSFFAPGAGLTAQYANFILVFVGLALLVPSIAHGLARLLRHPWQRFFGVEGALACDSLIQAPRRTSSTVGALMFSLAFTVSNSTLTVSIKQSFLNWMKQTINADMFVTSTENLASRVFHFPPAMAADLAAVPGVRQVDSVRILNHDYRGNPVLLFSIEMSHFFRRASFILKEGNAGTIERALTGSDAVIVSDNFSYLYNIHSGDTLELATPTGLVRFRVAAVMEDYGSDKGTVAMDRQTYVRHWKDDLVDTFDLMLEPGVSAENVKRLILSRLGLQKRLFVLTNEDFRAKIIAIIDQFFALSYVQIIVAMAVAILGIINTLFISISDRRRDIGIFKVVGGLQRQVRKMILLEACCISLIATLLGVVSGAYLAYFTNRTIGLTFSGWWIPYTFAWSTALLIFPIMVAVGVLSAWYPANTAVKLPLVDALGYE